MKRNVTWILLIAIVVLLSLMIRNLTPMASGQAGRQGPATTPDNYDIRTDRTIDSQEKRERQRQRLTLQQAARQGAIAVTMQAAQEPLARRVAGLQVTLNALTGGPEIVEAQLMGGAFLTPPSGQARAQIARDFIRDNAALYGLTAAQATQLVTTADYANPAGNLAWITLGQRFNGIPVFAGELRACLTPDGRLARTVSNLAAGMDPNELRTTPIISAAQAVALGAASIGVNIDAGDLAIRSASPDGRQVVFARGPFTGDIKAELVYFPLEPGLMNLAWSMTLWQDVPAYYTVVDAELGDLFFRKNITNDQTQSATYSVYSSDSPAPLSPSNATPGSGIQGTGVARTPFTLIGNEGPLSFNNLGWLTDGGNTTTGNNVDAGLDLVSPNGIDPDGRPTGSPNRVFSFTYNPPPLGSDPPTGADYRFGVVTNLFYWTNIYHDRLYQLGFTEQSGNFQTNNFSRGGLGNDAVLAEAQDFSGTNNANFATPADGAPGRMQMYIFTPPTPDRDGGLDQEIVIHELTHGLSNRLHNNAAGLTTLESRGMGEGWSDFYARALLATADEDVNGVYASGGYSTLNLTGVGTNNYYYGIRRFPYAVKTNLGTNGRPHNPLTFADIDPVQINLSDGAFPPSFVGAAQQVHNMGEVWCMSLLEVRARIINRLGFAAGNQRALQIVTDGMKLDPINPNFLEARNSILRGDCSGFSGADEMDIWAGFAARGMGFSASVNGGISYTEAFDLPNLRLGNVTFSDAAGCTPNGFADPGETVTLTAPLSNPFCTTNATGVTASVTGGGSANYGAINAGGAATQNISYTVPPNAQCGSTITVTVNINSSLGAVTRTFTLVVGQPVTALSQNFDGVTVPSLPAGWTSEVTGSGTNWITQTTAPDSPPNNAFTSNPATSGSASLISPNISIVSPTAQLSFRQLHNTETSFDGGVLEIKIGSGAFTDIITAGGSFVRGGYNGRLIADPNCSASPNPLANRLAWTGNSETYFTTTVNLPASAAGQTIQLRWRMGTDCAFSAVGWRVDTISVIGDAACVPCPDGACPTVSSINPTGATAGSQVTINGTNFNGVSAVRFTNNVAAQFTVNSNTRITATVPASAVTGPITITETGCPDARTPNFTVCPAITLAPTSLPNVVVNTAYSQTITASGGTAPYSFAVTAGTLPGGLTLSSGGALSGTPSAVGAFNFTVTATAANGCTGTRSYTVVVTGVPGSNGFLYVLNDSTNGNQLYGYEVNEATGALTSLTGFPLSTGGAGAGLLNSEQLTVDRANLRLYAVNRGSGTISSYSINPATGALTPLPFNPINLGAGNWAAIAVHPSGSPLVIGRGTGTQLLSYQITATTATAAAGSPYSTGNAQSFSAAFSQDGAYVYTGGNLATTIAGFSVNATTGVLSALAGSPFEAGNSLPAGYATDASGRLFVAHIQAPQVRVFTTASGIPSAVSGNPFASGLTESVHGLQHPNGFYLVADRVGNRVGVFQISGSGSATTLAAVTGSPFVAGGTLTDALALNQAGTFLFAANGDSRNLTAFGVNPATGALTSLGTQPANTLGTSGRLTGMAYMPAASTPCPTVSGISPTSGAIGATVTISGANFTGVSGVRFSNNVTATFTVVNNTTITAVVPNGAVTGPITIIKAGCNDVRTASFTVVPLNPAPVITSLNPNSAAAGGAAFTLTVNGNGFIASSVVRWNSSPRSTTFVSDTQLRAAIAAGDIANAGTANVTVFNPAPGGGESPAQTFTIQSATQRVVRVVPANGAPGATVVVPIELVSQGDENALGFSLTFDQAILSAPQAALGADATGATLNTNASQAAQGRFGVILALPSGGMFSAGTRRIVNVTFTIANTQATSTNIGFGDQPVLREVSNVNASRLPANYTPGVVTITSGFEADVAPRPNGDGTVTVIDYVQLGRFAAGLDTAANGSEFQRADCAPRADKGDGRLTTTDWVQAGRYAAGLDPVVTAGGPTSPVSVTTFASTVAARAVKSDEPRLLRVITGDHLLGATRTVVVELDAQGDESALGFSLLFNPSEWRFVSAEAGRDAREAVIHFNANEAARGRLGLVLALPASGRFSAGARQIVALKFAPVSGPRAKPLAIGFADEPVSREVVSGEAFALPARYEVKSTSPNVGALANVSAASLLAGELAAGQIVAAFGENLAPATQTAASLPLPMELAGVRVLVTDSQGVERPAPLFFTSPTQINYLLPEEMAEGVATVKIANSEGAVSLGVIEVAAPAPSLFTANADGQGVAAAVALRVRSDGTQSFEPVAQFDAAQGRFVASPIDLGREGDEVFLLLFGTGLRGGRAEDVTVSIGGAKVEVLFAGPQGGMAGLDQINLRLPRSLTGRGEVDVALMIGGKPANLVRARID